MSNFDSLAEKTSIATKRHYEVLDEIKVIEKRMTEISQLRTHVRNYLKTRDAYVAYCKAGYSKRFATEHQDEIQLHKAIKKHLIIWVQSKFQASVCFKRSMLN